MKKNVIFVSIFLLMAILIFSCEKNNISTDRKPKSFITNARINGENEHKKRILNIASGKYSFEKIDIEKIKNKIKNCKNEEDVISVFKHAGMTNAEQYVKSITTQIENLALEIKNNPELYNSDENTKKAFISRSIDINKNLFKKMIKAKIPCDGCYTNYTNQWSMGYSNYTSSLSSAFTGMITSVVGSWGSFFTGGFSALTWSTFWGVSSSIGFFDSYWAVFSAENQWNSTQGYIGAIFNDCIFNCQ